MTASISLSLDGSLLLLLALVAAAAAAALYVYRTTLPPLSRGRRTVLAALRLLALAMLCALLFEPVLRLVRATALPPEAALLVDRSKSMALRDGGGNRADALRGFLRGARAAVPAGVDLRYYLFAGRLGPPSADQPGDSIDLTGDQTNIADALSGLKDRIRRDNIQSVLLVTDGNYTAGRNPLYDAEALGVPVYTVGIGDTAEQRDVLVEKVATNDIAYAGTRVPVDITVKSSGYTNERVEVTVGEGGAASRERGDRAMITLQPGTNEYPVRLYVEPKEEGPKKYTAAVSALPGELTERNNTHTFGMKVLKSRLRILLFAGAPSPDVPAVRQALLEDPRFTVTAFVQKSENDFYEGNPARSALDSADCLVFAGFPSSATGAAIVNELRRLIDERQKPLLFINGRGVDARKCAAFEQVLPFQWSGRGGSEMQVVPAVPDARKNDALVTAGGAVTAEAWNDLPPLFKEQTVFRAKPGAVVLAGARVQSVDIGEPLVASRLAGRQKSLGIAGYGIWRWRVAAQGNAATSGFLPAFLSNAVRWLTTEEENRNVRIAPLKETFTTAEAAEFAGQVYDEELRPVDHADVTVELTRGKERFQLPLTSAGNGRYEGSINGLGEGEYEFTGRAASAGSVIGTDRGRFTIGQTNAEYVETKMNKALLEQIAFRTGGKYFDAGSAAAIAGDMGRDVRFSPREEREASEVELWNLKEVALIIVGLLAVEWFLRKKSGMT